MNEITYELANNIMRDATRASITPILPKGLTKEQLFYWRLKNDLPFYSENFLKIRDKNSKLVDFKLNEAQIMVEALDKYCKENRIMRRYIILKARQMGISTYTEGKIFQETANNELTRSMIVAHEEKASSNLFNMSKMYYEELPDVIRPMKKFNNGKVLSFENPTNDESEKKKTPGLRSLIKVATAGTGEVGRSETPTKLHISELAFFPDAEITMLGLIQGVPDTLDTLVIYESTANGVGDYFHREWQRAIKGESDFIPIFLPWFTDSTYVKEFRSENHKKQFEELICSTTVNNEGNTIHTYEYELMKKFNLSLEQMLWRDWAIRNKCGGDEEKFMQEYPSTHEEAFLATGRPVFSIKALKEYQTITREAERGYLYYTSEGKVAFRQDDKGYMHIWNHPQFGRNYSIGVDVAEGLANGDYSCGTVGCSETFDIDAMWHGHIAPDLLGKEMVKLARYYNNAYLGVENNNHGLTTLNSIRREEYWSLYFTKSYDRIADKLTQKLGWTTSIRTKPLMIDKLAQFIREKHLGIYSDLIISELFTYVVEDNGKTNAQQGCYDDTVMATAIMLQLLLENVGEDYEPEIPLEHRRRGGNVHIIDPLFERDNEEEVEVTE